MAFREAPNSRNWKPSPGPWAVRWPGHRRPRGGSRPAGRGGPARSWHGRSAPTRPAPLVPTCGGRFDAAWMTLPANRDLPRHARNHLPDELLNTTAPSETLHVRFADEGPERPCHRRVGFRLIQRVSLLADFLLPLLPDMSRLREVEGIPGPPLGPPRGPLRLSAGSTSCRRSRRGPCACRGGKPGPGSEKGDPGGRRFVPTRCRCRAANPGGS